MTRKGNRAAAVAAAHQKVLTVDDNGHALAKRVAVCALKGRNAVQWVQLEVLGTAFVRLCIDILDVELVCFGHGADAQRAAVALRRRD